MLMPQRTAPGQMMKPLRDLPSSLVASMEG